MDNKHPQAAECIPGKMHKATKHGRNRDGCQIQVSLFSVVQVSLSILSLVWGRNVTFSFLLCLLKHLPHWCLTYLPSNTPFRKSATSPQKLALRVFYQGASSGLPLWTGGPSWIIAPVLCIWHWTTWGKDSLLFLLCSSSIPKTEPVVEGTQEHMMNRWVN